jgi:hypothetical protein
MQRGTKPMPRSSKPLPAVNVARKAKRQQRYKRYLSSAAWKARSRRLLRLERATAASAPSTACAARTHRRPWRITSRYARFGGAELPEDLRALCRSCDRIETKLHRANHFSPR